jgi:HEAT repeat protein
LDATRRYLKAQAVPDPAARRAALRETTLWLLGSRDARVAASALRALVVAGDAFELGPADRDRLTPLLDRATASLSVRIGLLAELERRRLVDGPSRWARLLETTRGADLRSVVRAAAAHPSPEVTTALVRIATGHDVTLAAEAAVALGTPGNDAAVDPLSRLLSHGDPRVRMAAVRGLGRVANARAVEALRHAAAFHTDPGTRRRAGAEVLVLERGRRPVVAQKQDG